MNIKLRPTNKGLYAYTHIKECVAPEWLMNTRGCPCHVLYYVFVLSLALYLVLFDRVGPAMIVWLSGGALECLSARVRVAAMSVCTLICRMVCPIPFSDYVQGVPPVDDVSWKGERERKVLRFKTRNHIFFFSIFIAAYSLKDLLLCVL